MGNVISNFLDLDRRIEQARAKENYDAALEIMETRIAKISESIQACEQAVMEQERKMLERMENHYRQSQEEMMDRQKEMVDRQLEMMDRQNERIDRQNEMMIQIMAQIKAIDEKMQKEINKQDVHTAKVPELVKKEVKKHMAELPIPASRRSRNSRQLRYTDEEHNRNINSGLVEEGLASVAADELHSIKPYYEEPASHVDSPVNEVPRRWTQQHKHFRTAPVHS